MPHPLRVLPKELDGVNRIPSLQPTRSIYGLRQRPRIGVSPQPPTHTLFLLPIPVLRTVFSKKFLAGLRQLYAKGRLDCRGPAASFSVPEWFEDLAALLARKKWFVYAKPHFVNVLISSTSVLILLAALFAIFVFVDPN